MPEVTLCRYCRQPINKGVDSNVVLRQAGDRFPEMLAHAECEQKRPASYSWDDWMRLLRWPRRPS